jgi:hypothetical protein
LGAAPADGERGRCDAGDPQRQHDHDGHRHEADQEADAQRTSQ